MAAERAALRVVAGLGLLLGLVLGLSVVLAAPARADCGPVEPVRAGPALDEAADREIAAYPERYENGRGRFWTVRDPSGSLRGHLYGTLHVPHGGTTWLPGPVYTAFAGARALAVEVDATASAGPSPALLPQHATWIQGVPVSKAMEAVAPGLLEPELRRLGITVEQADRMGPFGLTARLGAIRCRLQGRAPGAIVDLLLQDWARTLDKPVLALETPDEARRANGFDLGRQDQFQLLAVALRRARDGDPQIPALLHHYAEGRIDRALALGRTHGVDEASRPAVERYLARLFDERNARFAQRLDGIFREGPGVFAAFGAGHLAGREGVVARLRLLGWTIDPAPLER